MTTKSKISFEKLHLVVLNVIRFEFTRVNIWFQIRRCQSEINEIQSFEWVIHIRSTNKHIIWFQIIVYVTYAMNLLEKSYKLDAYLMYRFKRELALIHHLIKLHRLSKLVHYLIKLAIFVCALCHHLWKVFVALVIQFFDYSRFNFIHFLFFINFADHLFVVVLSINCDVYLTKRSFCKFPNNFISLFKDHRRLLSFFILFHSSLYLTYSSRLFIFKFLRVRIINRN